MPTSKQPGTGRIRELDRAGSLDAGRRREAGENDVFAYTLQRGRQTAYPDENNLLASARCPPSKGATRGLVKEGVLRKQVRQRVGGDVLAGIDPVCSVGGLNSASGLNPVHSQLRYSVSLAKILSVLGIESVARIAPRHTLRGNRLRATADVVTPWL